MDEKNGQSMLYDKTSEIARMALVTGLYVAVTILLSVCSFGLAQIRLSEMFNYLSIYNKRYILAVTLGVAISNLASPLGLLDVIVGSISTFLVLSINYNIIKRIRSRKWQIIITAFVFVFSMFTVAGQLTILYQTPFFLNWGIISLGELLSMVLGGIIIYWLSKYIDFIK